jgi:hypothetical protein
MLSRASAVPPCVTNRAGLAVLILALFVASVSAVAQPRPRRPQALDGPCTVSPAQPSVPSTDTVWIEDSLPADPSHPDGWPTDTAQHVTGSASFPVAAPAAPLNGLITYFAQPRPLTPPRIAVAYILMSNCEPAPTGIGVELHVQTLFTLDPLPLRFYWGEQTVFETGESQDSIIGRRGAVRSDTTYVSPPVRLGDLPVTGQWTRLEIPIEISNADQPTVHTVALYSSGGQVWWDHIGLRGANTPPQTAITAPANRTITNNPLVQVSGTVTASLPITGVTVNGQPAAIDNGTWTVTVDYTGSGDGAKTITAVATDNSGAQAQASVQIAIDTAQPTISAHVFPPATATGWHKGDALVSFHCHDAGGAIATCPPSATLATEGLAQVVSGTTTDWAGNTASTSTTIKVDLTPPALHLDLADTGTVATNAETVLLTGTVNDALAGLDTITCNGIAATATNDAFACAAVTLDEGMNTIRVIATDRAGNRSGAQRMFDRDAHSPTIVISTPKQGEIVDAASVLVEGFVSDGNEVASLTVSGAAVPITAGRFSTTVPLAPGPNTIAVQASDATGNSATASVEVERRELLRVAITAPADLITVSAATVDVSGTVSDAGATVIVNNVSAVVTGTTFLASGVPLQQGRTVVTAVAHKADVPDAGASVFVYRDSIPPRVFVRLPAENATVYTETIAVSGLIDDIVVGTVNAAQAEVMVNGVSAAVSNRTFLAESVSLVPGPNTLTIAAEDQAGNVTSIVHHVTYDATPRARIIATAGRTQSGAISTQLPAPLIARVLDATGAPVASKAVTFTVRGGNGKLVHEASEGRELEVVTDAQGEASVQWIAGTRAGGGNDRVEARATGYAGPAVFTASVTPGAAERIVVDGGNSQFGGVSQALARPLIVAVVDAGGNRLEGIPVQFTALSGGGHIGGAPAATVMTDSDGRAWISPTLGSEEGNDNNVFAASIPSGASVEFVASGRVAGAAAATHITGVVADNSDLPLAGVFLRVDGTTISTQTDAQGQFTLPAVPVGYVKLIVDGSTTSRPGVWPTLEYAMFTISGTENRLEMPIYLLPIDVQRGIAVTETQGGTLTLPELPGFSLSIAPGSALFPNGSRAGTVSATLVHADKMPMAPAFGQQPQFVVTIQPPGVHFDPPAAVTFPNVEALEPGRITEMYSFDHDLGQFLSIGTGSISEDGTTLRSDPGVGIIKGGWHCGGDPTPAGTASAVHVSISLAKKSALAGELVDVTATGTPPTGGQYYGWTVDDPSVAVFESQPSCTGQSTCTARLRAITDGVVKVSVSFTKAPAVATSDQKELNVTMLELDSLQFTGDDPMRLLSGAPVPEFVWVSDALAPSAARSPAVNQTVPPAPIVQHPVRFRRSSPASATQPAAPRSMALKMRMSIRNPLTTAADNIFIEGDAYTTVNGARVNVAKFYRRANGAVNVPLALPAGMTTTDLFEFEADTPLPQTTYRYDPLYIDWTYRIGEGEPRTIGQSANPVYVLLRHAQRRHDFLEEELIFAVGDGGAQDENAAFSNTWRRFSNLSAGPANVTDRKGRPLTYYGVESGGTLPPVCALSDSAHLVAGGNGQCRTFVDLFANSLDANGIAAERWEITTVDGTFMFIGNWEFSPDVQPSEDQFPYDVTFDVPTFPGMGRTQTTPNVWYGEMRSVSGYPGQNSPTPLQKVFKNHVVVSRSASGGPYYDPSYGKVYINEEDFESKAVDAYGRPESTSGTDPISGDAAVSREFDVRKAPNWWVNIRFERIGW